MIVSNTVQTYNDTHGKYIELVCLYHLYYVVREYSLGLCQNVHNILE